MWFLRWPRVCSCGVRCTQVATPRTEADAIDQLRYVPGSIQLVKVNQQIHTEPIPDFLEITGSEPPEGRVTRLPTRTDVDPRLTKERELEENLIIEFCAR